LANLICSAVICGLGCGAGIVLGGSSGSGCFISFSLFTLPALFTKITFSLS
jgi:hypothetical protein